MEVSFLYMFYEIITKQKITFSQQEEMYAPFIVAISPNRCLESEFLACFKLYFKENTDRTIGNYKQKCYSENIQREAPSYE